MRLVIISNRLPFTVVNKSGELVYEESVGGLATGLRSYLANVSRGVGGGQPHLWLGWPGISAPSTIQKSIRKVARGQFHSHPVFLPKTAMDRFYLGFCNRTLWPLFHYFPSFAAFEREQWDLYREVNKAYADEAMAVIDADTDTVWIHDYHLMLLPAMLREKFPHVAIGFFLHIPFPSFEIFRLLPQEWRRELLLGMLGADLVGFHTNDYTQYFLRCVSRVLGYEHDLGRISTSDRLVVADTFPMGIDYQQFHHACERPVVASEYQRYREELAGRKAIVSVDRLDYTKGIAQRLRGFRLFLRNNPQWHDRVSLIMIVAPSRIGVDRYQTMKSQVDELVGDINGEFGTVAWTPVVYQYRSLNTDPLTALYAAADVALVTPIRDGMNLIAKEYVAARSDGEGVLILSEMAGAVKELGEALAINPTSEEEIAHALASALAMPRAEQQKRMRAMQDRLSRYTIVAWAEDFLETLQNAKKVQRERATHVLQEATILELQTLCQEADRRLLLLDYDGTLVPFFDSPSDAAPSADLLRLLVALSTFPDTDVVLISGRTRADLDRWFADTPLGLIAEHGVWLRRAGESWQRLRPSARDWKPSVLPILTRHADRLPGAFVEEKEHSLVWHYRRADPELASQRARELTDALVHLTAQADLQVLQGNRVVEIRPSGTSKGVGALAWLDGKSYDFILAVGDDWTDEDLFRVLPREATSVRVGMVQSFARYNVATHLEVLALLKTLFTPGLAKAGSPMV